MNKFESMVEKIPGLTSSEAFLLYRLASYANARGECWPSIRRLQRDTRLNERTIYYVLNELEARNILTRYPLRGRSTTYILNFENILDRVKKEQRDRWGRSRNCKDHDLPETLEPPGPELDDQDEDLGLEFEEFREKLLRKYNNSPILTEERIIKMWKKQQGSVTA